MGCYPMRENIRQLSKHDPPISLLSIVFLNQESSLRKFGRKRERMIAEHTLKYLNKAANRDLADCVEVNV